MTNLSAQQLRDEFKVHLDKWQNIDNNPLEQQQVLSEIQKWSANLEKFIQEKLALLETDFQEYSLQDEYLRSVSEGFDDVEQIMKTHKTLIDVAKGATISNILEKIKKHYTHYFVPLLNIIAKLENDYVSITTKTIVDKGAIVEKIEEHLKELKKEKQQIKSHFFDFNRKEKYLKLIMEIKKLELRKKIIRLTLHHHKLNLYYFNHDRPPELKEIKEKADKLRDELYTIEKEINHGQSI